VLAAVSGALMPTAVCGDVGAPAGSLKEQAFAAAVRVRAFAEVITVTRINSPHLRFQTSVGQEVR
jgi:hypothetical protein